MCARFMASPLGRSHCGQFLVTSSLAKDGVGLPELSELVARSGSSRASHLAGWISPDCLGDGLAGLKACQSHQALLRAVHLEEGLSVTDTRYG